MISSCVEILREYAIVWILMVCGAFLGHFLCLQVDKIKKGGEYDEFSNKRNGKSGCNAGSCSGRSVRRRQWRSVKCCIDSDQHGN